MKQLRITVDGKTYDVTVETLGASSAPVASVAAAVAPVAPAPVAAPAAPVPTAPAPVAAAPVAGGNAVPAPLTAVVVSIDVKIGDKVSAGQKVATLEAMKMNTYVVASASGEVASILVKSGDSVQEGQALITLK